MSQYNSNNQDPYGSAHSPSKTERDRLPDRGTNKLPSQVQGPRTQRNNIHDSPSKYDIQFYQRKVNRLQSDMAALQDQLSLARFRLSKAEDYQRKYDIAFRQNQDLVSEMELKNTEFSRLSRENQQLRIRFDQAQQTIKKLNDKLQNQRKNNNQLREKQQQLKSQASTEGISERASIQQSFYRQIDNLKQDFKSKEQKLQRQIRDLQTSILTQQVAEKALKFKFQSIKTQKNKEIDRLKNLSIDLKTQLTTTNRQNDDKSVESRTRLINQTQNRIQNVRRLANDIEQCLMNEIRCLNVTLKTKNSQIQFILQADKKFMEDNQQTQNGLKDHIKRLQDKIFVIQRENEIQLFTTIDRLQNQYQQNLNNLNDQFDRVRKTHQDQVVALKTKILNLQKENTLLSHQNKRVQSDHKKLSEDKESAIKMLSQKIINLESSKDIDLKNYTTSMKQIQIDAKSKLQDLHTAIQSKNNQSQILNAQLALKNQQISSLIEEINKLRNQNREKMRKLQTTNALEQNALNDLISNYKKEVMELKRTIHELQSEMNDRQSQAQLKINLAMQDLESQKQANQMLKARNNFLVQWCQQLQRDLKTQRVSNVNILHDTNISRRQTVQIRQQVRVQLQAIKNKEVEQIRNIFKLQKNRLESDLLNNQHELRQKKEQLSRLLVEYKKLQNKLGKSSKFDKGSQQQGKCKATLNAQILLTENIFNAINTQ